MQTRWIQSVQRWPITSLQTKATLLVIAIVAGVLGLSTFLNIRVSEHALERDLRDSAVALARQFAAGIGSWEELNNPTTLQVDIGQVMEDRPSIVRVEVYAMAHGVPHFITSIDEEVQTNPAPEVFQVAQENKPMAVQRQGRTGRQWEAVVPVHLNDTLAGVVRLQVSLREADRLAYRLSVVTITLPRLSERREDIPLLALHFLGKYASEAGKGLSHIAPEAMALLCQYNWPGNVRELEHVIERAVALTADPILLVEDLPTKLQGLAPTSDVFPSLDEMEKRHLQLALEKTAGNRRQAAMLLGVSRRTLYRMAKRHGLISDNTHE